MQPTDTICPLVSTYQNLVIAASQKKVLEQQIVILNERINNTQLQISQLQFKDSVTVASYEAQIKLMIDQRQILERQIRKMKRREFWTRMGIGTLTGVFVYMYVMK